MRWRAITREAWRNVVSGTSRAGIVAVVLAVLTIVVGVIMSKMGMGSYTYSEGDTATNSESLGIK